MAGLREKMPRLSAALMVYNGIKTLPRCLDALAFCDEIVVADDCSTDGTWEYLQQHGVKSIRHRHTTFAAQRELAKEQTTGDWVLTMDADEYVTPELAASILAAIREPGAPDGFFLKHRTPYPPSLGRGYFWSWHTRLMRRDKCRWQNTDNPHSPPDRKGVRLRKLRPGFMEHEPLEDLAGSFRKSINRSLILAAFGRKKGKRSGALRAALSAFNRFLKMFFLHGAWKHGSAGFFFSSAAAFEAFAKHAFLFEQPKKELLRLLDGGPGSFPPPEKGS